MNTVFIMAVASAVASALVSMTALIKKLRAEARSGAHSVKVTVSGATGRSSFELTPESAKRVLSVLEESTRSDGGVRGNP